MSHLIILTGHSSELSFDFFTPLELEENSEWVIGLHSLQTYYSIPNIDTNCNKFHYGNGKVITIPVGNYEVEDIERYLKNTLGLNDHLLQEKRVNNNNNKTSKKGEHYLSIFGNNNTLKCEIISSYEIDFSQSHSVGSVLGFDKRKLPANTLHTSDLSINIQGVNAILVECNIATGAYKNGELVHTIHEFFPSVDPGYKILEQPSTIIYLPVNVRNITNVSVKLVDQDGRLINFQKEKITILLHLKKIKYS